jgi:hypothetical protein
LLPVSGVLKRERADLVTVSPRPEPAGFTGLFTFLPTLFCGCPEERREERNSRGNIRWRSLVFFDSTTSLNSNSGLCGWCSWRLNGLFQRICRPSLFVEPHPHWIDIRSDPCRMRRLKDTVHVHFLCLPGIEMRLGCIKVCLFLLCRSWRLRRLWCCSYLRRGCLAEWLLSTAVRSDSFTCLTALLRGAGLSGRVS